MSGFYDRLWIRIAILLTAAVSVIGFPVLHLILISQIRLFGLSRSCWLSGQPISFAHICSSASKNLDI